MLNEHFVVVAAALNLIGAGTYALATLQGRTRPNRVTWALWTVAPLVAFAAELGEGVGLTSLMTFMVGFGPLLIFLASFVNPRAYWKIGCLDITCGILSVATLVLWWLTRTGNVAIALSIATDGLAATPTVIKAYQHPETENPWVFVLAAVSAVITLLTAQMWLLAVIGFPAYIFAVTVLIAGIIIVRTPLMKTRSVR